MSGRMSSALSSLAMYKYYHTRVNTTTLALCLQFWQRTDSRIGTGFCRGLPRPDLPRLLRRPALSDLAMVGLGLTLGGLAEKHRPLCLVPFACREIKKVLSLFLSLFPFSRAAVSPIQRASAWSDVAHVCCHGDQMGTGERRSLSAEEQLSPEEHAWLSADQRLRDEARALADKLGRDPDDIYRALRQLRRTPAERLRLGLRHARLHPKYR